MDRLFFWIFAAVAVGGGVSTVTRHRPLACALSLVACFLGLAGLYFQQHAPFPGILQVMLYAGAIMVLVLFVIMFLNLPDSQLENQPDVREHRTWPLLLTVPLGAVLVGLVQVVDLKAAPPVADDFGSVATVGRELFTTWVYPFEVMSLLLLVAVVGAVVIAKKRLT